MSEIMHIKNIQ